jgi:hypothetical protein
MLLPPTGLSAVEALPEPHLVWMSAAEGPAVAVADRDPGTVAEPAVRPASPRPMKAPMPHVPAARRVAAKPAVAQTVLPAEAGLSLAASAEAPADHPSAADMRAATESPAAGAPPSSGSGLGSSTGGGGGLAASHAALARTPRLIASADPCAGYFPAAAQAQAGEVRILARVDSTGHARGGRVIAQRPLGQGFDRAARACLAHLRFDPALDTRGALIDGEATLQIRFVRH